MNPHCISQSTSISIHSRFFLLGMQSCLTSIGICNQFERNLRPSRAEGSWQHVYVDIHLTTLLYLNTVGLNSAASSQLFSQSFQNLKCWYGHKYPDLWQNGCQATIAGRYLNRSCLYWVCYKLLRICDNKDSKLRLIFLLSSVTTRIAKVANILNAMEIIMWFSHSSRCADMARVQHRTRGDV